MRLLGIDPNGLAQRVQFKIVKLLVAGKSDGAPRSQAPANVPQSPTTTPKVRIRNLPLPQSLQLAPGNDAAAKSPMAAPLNANADPVAVRAIARFTETQSRPVSPETADITVGASTTLPDTPALPTSAQISAMAHARQQIATQPGEEASHTDGGRAAQFLAAFATSHRGVATLLIVSGIALIAALS